jgi:hypothetical protein
MKYKTVYELLESPERWTQKKFAADKDGKKVSELDSRAVKFCLTGAIVHVYFPKGGVISAINSKYYQKVLKIICGARSPFSHSVCEFNDSHTHAEILELVKGAGI